MEKIWRILTFNICKAIYPLIPDIYNVFSDLASTKYFTQDQIKQISNNLYIVISVCMLFALGIKLLSAIVNPDQLSGGSDGKGKGNSARAAFFRCAAAVFLIVLVPIGFNELYEIQDNIIENKLVEKIVLSMDTTEDSDPGNIIAGYAFESFCHPRDKSSAEGLEATFTSVKNDVTEMDDLDEYISSKTKKKWDLEFSPIASIAVGLFVIYQLILFCMDIALRSIELGALQLITPLILCGYVIAGNDLLQRWFKEVIKTYTLLFVKIGTITFMVYSLSLLEEFMKNFDSYDSIFYKGIIKVFVLIGLLQFIKKLPQIIETIFGVKIESGGGIGTRLAAMAGVGKLASDAWGKVKTAAPKIGAVAGLAASGPLGWGAAALAGGVGFAGNRLWNKDAFGKGPLKNTKVGRGIRRIGAGSKGLWTGLTTAGGIGKSIEEGKKAYNETDIGKYDTAHKKGNIADYIKKDLFGIGANGSIEDVTSKEGEAATRAAIKYKNKMSENADKALNRAHISATDIKNGINDLSGAAQDKHTSAAIKSKYDSINSKLQSYQDSATDAATQAAIRGIQGKFLSGNMSSIDVTREIGRILGDEAAGSINADASKLQNLLQTTSSSGETFSNLLTTDKGGISKGDLNTKAGEFNNAYDSIKGELDSAKDAYNLDDNQKLAMDKIIESIDTTTKTFTDAQASAYVGTNTSS